MIQSRNQKEIIGTEQSFVWTPDMQIFLEKDTESICLRGDKDLVVKEPEGAKVVVLNEVV